MRRSRSKRRTSKSKWRGARSRRKPSSSRSPRSTSPSSWPTCRHELRTPLNSLLILSKLLADNAQGNLNEKQVEFARTINSAGSDLLNLINDILDLSKVESGTVTIEVGEMPMAHLKQHMERTFRQLAADKGLDFKVKFDGKLPETIRTDEKRLQQIVLNLLSNAFKFTSKGSVTFGVVAPKGMEPDHPVLRNSERAIEITVNDTGIGIPEDKQKLIFEAFQQADGTTSRKYGGTGLGLSISREIARLIGGELQVRSTPGEGSTFTLYVPLEAEARRAAAVEGTPARYENSGAVVPTALPTGFEVSDDRDDLGKDPFVLIVEDDPTFASILLDAAHEAGPQGRGFDRRRGHVGDGAQTPADRDHPRSRPGRHRRVRPARPAEARSRHQPHADPRHFGRRPQRFGHGNGRVRSDRKAGGARRPGRRLQVAPRAGREAKAAAAQGRPKVRARSAGRLPELAGAKVLIVDDDIRNIFSLTSVLESHDVEVLHAERGKDGILILEQTPGVDVALIDIMMPDMDGYETMRQIRQRPELADLPLIAVTAKAMKGDRQKCLDAGASDYIAKPVDIELLLALLRVWVARARRSRRLRKRRPF